MTMQEIFQLAEMLVRTQGILPTTIRTPGECVAIILAGRELGLQPMASLRLITLLKGKVTIDSSGQLALMQRAGAKVEWLKDGSDGKEARLRVTRAGSPPFETHYTIEMARTAGLLSNGTWQKYPQAMLRARCVSAAGKAYMADVLAGVYLPGEIEGDHRHEDHVEVVALPKALTAEPKPAQLVASTEPDEADPIAKLVKDLYDVTDVEALAKLDATARAKWRSCSETERQEVFQAIEHAKAKLAQIEADRKEAEEAERHLAAQEAVAEEVGS